MHKEDGWGCSASPVHSIMRFVLGAGVTGLNHITELTSMSKRSHKQGGW